MLCQCGTPLAYARWEGIPVCVLLLCYLTDRPQVVPRRLQVPPLWRDLSWTTRITVTFSALGFSRVDLMPFQARVRTPGNLNTRPQSIVRRVVRCNLLKDGINRSATSTIDLNRDIFILSHFEGDYRGNDSDTGTEGCC